MLRNILLAGAALAALATTAQADERSLPRAIDWTGFYAGLHAGWGRGHSTFEGNLLGGNSDHGYSGALLGAQFGWNYHVGQIVLGAEATLARAAFAGHGPPLASASNATFRTAVNWLTTMGPRAGFAFDRALVYAKGGFAIAGLNSGLVAPSGQTYRGMYARAGWFVGGGVEYALASNWSLKAEYNYVNFGRGQLVHNRIGIFAYALHGRADFHVVTVGLNYRIGGGTGAAPVAGGGVPIWSGFYAGLHAGYGASQFIFPPDTILARAGTNGALAGVQFGWNHQVGQIVLGMEATLTYSGARGLTELLITTMRTDTNWFATMGPRVGFALDRALIFAKGGFAFAGSRGGYEMDGLSRASHVHAGLFVGGGVEYAFAPNWSAKAEYNYVHFNRTHTSFVATSEVVYLYPTRLDAHLMTLGLNYRFTTGP